MASNDLRDVVDDMNTRLEEYIEQNNEVQKEILRTLAELRPIIQLHQDILGTSRIVRLIVRMLPIAFILFVALKSGAAAKLTMGLYE